MIEKEAPPYLLILSGDHIYKMDYSDMYEFHITNGADATIAAIEMDSRKASDFGVIEVNRESRVIGFEEKPRKPKTIPGKPRQSFVSMGVYLFKTEEIHPGT